MLIVGDKAGINPRIVEVKPWFLSLSKGGLGFYVKVGLKRRAGIRQYKKKSILLNASKGDA